MSIKLYGNTIWNTNISNNEKNIILTDSNKFNEAVNILEICGLNYCAYIYDNIAHIAVNKSDVGKLQNLPVKYQAILPTSKSNILPEGNIIGTTSYKNILNKTYHKYDTDLAYKIAQRLQEQNIPYSGRLYNKTITITVDETFVDVLNSIVTQIKQQRGFFENENDKTIMSNSDSIIFDKAPISIAISQAEFNSACEHLKRNEIEYVAVSVDGKLYNFYTQTDKESFQSKIKEAKYNLLSESFNGFITELGYESDQVEAIAAVKNLLLKKMNDEHIVSAFRFAFEKTNMYSSTQLERLSNEFVNIFEKLNGFECVFADMSSITNLKLQFDNELLFQSVTEGKGYSKEQTEIIKQMVDAGFSKIVLDLLDYTFSADSMNEFMKAFTDGSYDGLLNVIAAVKHTTRFEIDGLIESGEYSPELPPLSNDEVLNEMKKLVDSHNSSIANSSDERQSIVINAFAGPGAGKTTSCLEIAERLKKQGYVTEYVQEYAKELVWDNKLDLLDGSFPNQFSILREQLKRIDRLYGKCDFIVTDSPVLLNATYLKEANTEYINNVKELYNQFDNFNYFVERDISSFETEGRIHNLEESIKIDNALKDTLSELGIEYSIYNHSTVADIVNDVIEYKKNYSVEAQKHLLKKAQKVATENDLPFSDKLSYGADDEIVPYVYDGSMSTQDFEKMQNNIKTSERDCFFLRPENGTIEWVYYNPDSENGQIVQNILSVDEMLKAVNLETVDEFQEYLSENAKQFLIDINGIEEYIKFIYESPYEVVFWDNKEKSFADLKQYFLESSNRLNVENKNNSLWDEYCKVAEKNTDTVVLYRVGAFYEIMGNNAEIAAKTLNLTLTSRSITDAQIPIVGIPLNTLNDYSNRLAESGHKVLIYDDADIPIRYINPPEAANTENRPKESESSHSFEKSTKDNQTALSVSGSENNQTNNDNNIKSPKTEQLSLEIGFTESSLLRDFMNENYPDHKIPFALGNALLEFLDEKQNIERDVEELNVGYYDKTHFTITAIINGDDYSYNGRFDIGDGKENGNGSLINHIESFLTYHLKNNPYNEREEDLAETRDYLDTAIPYFKEHSQLTADEQKILDEFKTHNPIFSLKEENKNIEAVSEEKMFNILNASVEQTNEQADKSDEENFKIADSSLGATGAKAKFNNNINAINTLKLLEQENRHATEEEKIILSLYSGWGGLAQAFNDKNDNWRKEYNALKELLTNDEYSSARASTLDSFYTGNEIIDSIYKVLENNGFNGGNILEPAMGIGNFFGRLPETLQHSSNLYGVEKDSISGRIATKLYPQANITIDGFENTAFQDDSFDVTIGNIPFGDSSVNDNKYNSQKLKIHDYFFMKTLDKVRPGGIVAFVTSKGTLDKKDNTFRLALSKRADLVGAIRLPNNSFKAAGTEVTSDIIFLQKLSAPPENIPDWVYVGKTGEELSVNNYFLNNPKMVLGEIVQGNKLYGKIDDTMCIPFKNANLSELLSEAIKNIKFTYRESQDKSSPIIDKNINITVPEGLRTESFFISGNDLYFYGNTSDGNLEIIPAKEILGRKYTAKNIERAKSFITIREDVRALLDAQQYEGNDNEIKELQDKLNNSYDSFYKKYGLLHSRLNRNILGQDNAYPLVSSLEAEFDNDKLVKKSDIFTQRVNKPAHIIEHVETALEALNVSVAEKGFVDLKYMSLISDIPEKNLIAKLQGEIFPVPELSTDDNIVYQTASEYLSGDIYSKLDTAKLYAKQNDLFEANCEALEKSIPTPLKAGDIDINLGATWIDIKYYQQFMYEVFQTPNEHRVDRPPRFSWQMKGRRNIEIEYSKYTGRWNIKNANADKSVITTKTYGAADKTAYTILENILNLNDPKAYKNKTDEYGHIVYDKNDKPIRVLDVAATKVLQQKANAIKREFKDWIFKDPQRRTDIVDTYNRMFNCIKPREYDGSNMKFPGMNPSIELHEHQKNAIAHAIHGGNTLFAHSVGAGKTFEMIATAMESKRLGFCNKSMFCVPNHLTEQVGSDFLRLYSQANILIATKNDFTKENRQRFMSKIATGNYDAVIIGHSQLTKLPLSPERQKAIYEEQISDIIEGIRELKAENGSSFQVKAMERTRKSLEKQLEKLESKGKDNTVYFEELGIDKLFVDEAHEFKNLLSVTKLQNVSGLSSRASQRATELFMKCRYLDEKTGGKGVVFATGTPISNSITELHTMMRYLQYDFLTRHNNMQNFDNWVSSFGVQKTDYELAPTGNKFRERTRIAEYANLPELMAMFKQSADIRTSDTLDLNVPDCEMHIVNVDSTDLQKDMVEELSMRADDVNQGDIDPSVDNMLKITSDGRKLGLDPRLIDPNLEDNPNTKLNVCVNNVFDIYSKTSDEKLTQIIFCDLGVPNGKNSNISTDKDSDDGKSISELDSLEETGTFCIYDDIKSKLVAKGVPANEIAFIHDANTEQQKSELFAKVRSGEVRILLGSTGKMGTGTNVQDRIIAMHDLDVPWRPSDLEQRRGRMVRQGNINEKVHLYRYVTKGTFDAYSYQILEKKQKFISQIMTSKTPARRCSDVDQEALTYSEIKALCTGDERIKEKMTLENRVKELALYKAEYTNTKYELEDKIRSYPAKRMELLKSIGNIQSDIKKYATFPRTDDNLPEFKITILGTDYTDRKEAAKAFGKAVALTKKEENRHKSLYIGEYCGFSIELINNDYFLSDIDAKISASAKYTIELGSAGSNSYCLKKIEHSLSNLDKILQSQKEQLNKLDIDYESANDMLSKPFEFEEELRQKSERLEQVTDELNGEAAKLKDSEMKQKRNDCFGKKLILSKSDKVKSENTNERIKPPKNKNTICF